MAKKPTRPIAATVRARLKKLPGKSRRYIDPKTRKTYSRRQFEKGRVRAPRKGVESIARKQSKYITIRDIYIHAKAAEGKKLGKREAMESAEFKRFYKNLHNKNIQVRQAAFDGITGGDKAEWIPYIQRWSKGDL